MHLPAPLPAVRNIQRVYRISLDNTTGAPQTIDISLDLIVSSDGDFHLDVRSLTERSRMSEVGVGSGQALTIAPLPIAPAPSLNSLASSPAQASSSHSRPAPTPPVVTASTIPLASTSRATPPSAEQATEDEAPPQYSLLPPPPDGGAAHILNPPFPAPRALAPLPHRARTAHKAPHNPPNEPLMPPALPPSVREYYAEAASRPLFSSSEDEPEELPIDPLPRRKRFLEHWEELGEDEDELTRRGVPQLARAGLRV
ncbi:hypothetical protein C8R46DRAFT_1208954 [Mycena filopes]|nr:hypothetical protein C8R46DRAFT_1208954 [Mycena filopes]